MTNIVVANLAKSRFYRCPPLYQYNYGMKLKIVGVDLPDAYEVDFANDVSGSSITQVGGADGVSIPSQFFQPGQAIYCWLRVHPTVDSGVTTATIVIPISPRATITDDEPTPEEQSAIDEAIAALNDAVDKAEDAVEHYPTITNGVWYVWDVGAGEYVSTGISATGPQGERGETGSQGPRGETGSQGPRGETGATGAAGADGFSPVATVTQTQTGATISITDKQGTTTANIANGQDGSPGQPGTDGTDGVSPTVTVTDITGGHRITITDATGAHSFDVMDGQDGQGTVQDVQVNGVSVLSDGVANVPVASADNFGAVKVGGGLRSTNGLIAVDPANSTQIKLGSVVSRPIAPYTQDASTFYGLAKAAGDSSQSLSSNAVGQYTESAKSAISTMLNGPVTVSGTTPSITALPGIQYVCGEVSTLDITLPASGIVDVVFQSGSTATVLTITPPTGQTVRWANGFDPTALETNTTYRIRVFDGAYAVSTCWSNNQSSINTPVVLYDTTFTENFGSNTPHTLMVTISDVDGVPLSELKLSTIIITCITTQDPNNIAKWPVKISLNDERLNSANNITTFQINANNINKKYMQIINPNYAILWGISAASYSQGNIFMSGDDMLLNKDYHDKYINKITFFTSYPNGTIWLAGTRLQIIGW